jgi:elongation factor 3
MLLNTVDRDAKILSTLQTFATNKKSGYERESGALGYHSLATILGARAGPLLLPSLPTLYDLLMDKGDVVRAAASSAIKAILKLFPPESVSVVFRNLETILDNGKWRSKVGVLDGIKLFVNSARDEVAAELATLLPHVENAMHDTKAEVRRLIRPRKTT